MNTETAYYRARTTLEQMKSVPDGDIPPVPSGYTSTLDTDYWILLQPQLDNALQSLEPAGFQLLPNYPNPFNAGTQIPLRLNRAVEVSLTIFDILGRQVQTLHQGRLSAGEHLFYWDGKNRNGFSVGSGNYLLILSNSKLASVRKLNIVK